jgi:hypothetical protein
MLYSTVEIFQPIASNPFANFNRPIISEIAMNHPFPDVLHATENIYIAKGRGQRAPRQKGCILTGLGFSFWLCPNWLGDCYKSSKR